LALEARARATCRSLCFDVLAKLADVEDHHFQKCGDEAIGVAGELFGDRVRRGEDDVAASVRPPEAEVGAEGIGDDLPFETELGGKGIAERYGRDVDDLVGIGAAGFGQGVPGADQGVGGLHGIGGGWGCRDGGGEGGDRVALALEPCDFGAGEIGGGGEFLFLFEWPHGGQNIRAGVRGDGGARKSIEVRRNRTSMALQDSMLPAVAISPGHQPAKFEGGGGGVAEKGLVPGLGAGKGMGES